MTSHCHPVLLERRSETSSERGFDFVPGGGIGIDYGSPGMNEVMEALANFEAMVTATLEQAWERATTVATVEVTDERFRLEEGTAITTAPDGTTVTEQPPDTGLRYPGYVDSNVGWGFPIPSLPIVGVGPTVGAQFDGNGLFLYGGGGLTNPGGEAWRSWVHHFQSPPVPKGVWGPKPGAGASWACLSIGGGFWEVGAGLGFSLSATYVWPPLFGK